MKTAVERNLGNTTRAIAGRAPLQPLPRTLCVFCEGPADPQSSEVIVETHGRRIPGDHITQIWHRSCFDDFLDRGEET